MALFSCVLGSLVVWPLHLSYYGTHHAQVLLAEGAVARVAVVDLDVHQGDGTAVCLQ